MFKQKMKKMSHPMRKIMILMMDGNMNQMKETNKKKNSLLLINLNKILMSNRR